MSLGLVMVVHVQCMYNTLVRFANQTLFILYI